MREVTEANKGEATRQAPRVCVCVMMNHPYPANLPLLRRVYEGRFSELLFLIPFERVDAPDVITTYRGSYVHAAYIADALERLKVIECDHFIFVHDDVLLNPQFDENSFAELMPIGPNDGFIPFVHPTPPKLGDWEWYFSFLPRLQHPKSLVFGSGIEPDNLLRYLPDRETIRAGFARSNAPCTEQVELDLRSPDDPQSRLRGAERSPSMVLLDGLAARLDHSTSNQQAVDAAAADALSAMTRMLRTAADREAGDKLKLELPFPLAVSGFFTDCYVLPRSRLEAFAHYMGVAGAAGLFVEIIVPVLLHALCDRVHTATSLDLDFSGFQHQHGLAGFIDQRRMAIHPFKFSTIRTIEQQDAFVAVIEDLRQGRTFDPKTAESLGLSPAVTEAGLYVGWHPVESWGRWASDLRSSVLCWPRREDEGKRPKLTLVAPVHVDFPRFSATVGVGSNPPRTVEILFPDCQAELVLDVPGDPHRPLLISFESDQMVVPDALNADSLDDRRLGIGLCRIDWV